MLYVKPRKVRMKRNQLEVTSDLYLKLKKHLAFFKENPGKDYLPIKFCVAVRSTYSNKVLVFKDTGEELPFKCYDAVAEGLTYLDDVCVLSCKATVEKYINNFSSIVAHSGAYPLGAVKYNSCYYVLSHIVVDDSVLSSIEENLLEECYLADIKDFLEKPRALTEMTSLGAILSSKLTIIKEEDK